jgi:hypothetical protein
MLLDLRVGGVALETTLLAREGQEGEEGDLSGSALEGEGDEGAHFAIGGECCFDCCLVRAWR